ncbi:MAG: DUF7714 family protein [Actinomycetota bacterium]
MRNLMPQRYRGVSVATVDVPLTAGDLERRLMGREAYRRTEFLVVRRGEETAVLRVVKAAGTDLFSPIVGIELMATAEECAFVRAPEVDTGVPTQMGNAARELAPGARCVVVQGLYEHVNFILDPAPVPVRVVEVVPPWPPKLLDQAQRVLQTAESLPPADLQPHIVDLVALAADRPSARYLYPCRGSGAAPPAAKVSYLDERPRHQDWTLIGCARSREIHAWVYGSEPPCIDLCPRRFAGAGASAGAAPAAEGSGAPVLTKCCLLETGIERAGSTVTVPWGASLAEVHEGLRAVLSAAEGP